MKPNIRAGLKPAPTKPMKYDPEKHHRRSIRLENYDYSNEGAYFVTICMEEKDLYLGRIVKDEIELNRFGESVDKCWNDLPQHYPHVELDEFVIMPNHVHGIIALKEEDNVGAGLRPARIKRAGLRPAPTPAPTKHHGLSEIVRAFKSFSSRHINKIRQTPGTRVWQRDYFERVVRDEEELYNIRQYIIDNPINWATDKENPQAKKREEPNDPWEV